MSIMNLSLLKDLVKPKKRRNLYISYIKGVAIICITLIHLIDWSDMPLTPTERTFKDLLLVGVFLFVLTTGSVLFISYEHRSPLEQVKRLLYRACQILGIYYLYSIIKLLIFDFSTEPLYFKFIDKSTFTIPDILFFRSYSVPITILITFAFFLALSPLILFIYKRSKFPGFAITLLIALIFTLNYFTPLPSINNPIVNFLYAKGNVLFSIMHWLVPLLVGFFLAQAGFEKQKHKILLIGGIFTAITALLLFTDHKSLNLSDNEFPLSPYFMFSGIFSLSLLLYAFQILQRFHNRLLKGFLATLRFLGDNTLHLFVYQWLVIDLTRWVFPKPVGLIWLTIPLFFIFYLLLNKNKLLKYYHHQKEATKDLGAEIL